MVHRYPRYDAIEEGQALSSTEPSEDSKSSSTPWKRHAVNALIVACAALAAALATHAMEQGQWWECERQVGAEAEQPRMVGKVAPATPAKPSPKKDSLAALREESTGE